MSALVVEGGVVHYEYYGHGSPLIFIHGWLGSWRYWVPVMDELSESHRVYAIDLWGFGDSDKSRNQYTVENYVRLLHTFVNDLGVRNPFPLVGHALGATIAILFSARYPEMVNRIMAVSLPWASNAINTRSLQGSNLLDRVLGRSPMAGYEEWVRQEASRAAPEAIEKSVQSVMDVDLNSWLPSLQAPLLILHGKNDTVITPVDPSNFAHAGKSVRVLIMPQARHFPMLDQSSQFNRLLIDFLGADSPLDSLTLKQEWQRRVR
jgi:pimeloyl-ACP methyl ester carboxylesterase